MWVFWIRKKTVCSSIGDFKCIYLYYSLFGFELFRVEGIKDGAWIMNRREWEFVGVVIHFLIFQKHVIDSFCKDDMLTTFEMINDLLGG
jgi:hypothetical protein